MRHTNVDDPASWVKYRAGLCVGCEALCCTMPVEVRAADLVRLELMSVDEAEFGRKKAAKRLMRQGIVRFFRESTGIFQLERQSGGECVFLTKERRCSVYERRPETCRNFPKVSSRPGYCPAMKMICKGK